MDWLYYGHYSPSSGEHELTSEELRWHESPPVDGRCCIIHKRGVANTCVCVCVCFGCARVRQTTERLGWVQLNQRSRHDALARRTSSGQKVICRNKL